MKSITAAHSDALLVMEAMKESNDRRMFERYQVIHLHLKGYKQKFLKGKQIQITTYGPHRGAKLLGTLNYETGENFVSEAEHCMTIFQLDNRHKTDTIIR
ncbi:hypothetical protein [Mesobacillus subterraneus]|uniref:Uncharacterized protein n=1 Tax=Mesobacillus subterraneus TaxID=285983 RepID=A0A0D6ZDF3_9BACI|nr:hypothetical protein [Mesobacillus subterraneus]KIY23577.1 hypothetical protein UB32_01955 [Mesobacillus subterraneus]